MRKKLGFLFFLFVSGAPLTAFASHTNYVKRWGAHPFYIGVAVGWGCTDWSQLRIRVIDPGDYDTLSLSAPISAGDKGVVYGFMTGYEINPHFALELNYMRFPNTPVLFDKFSLYAFENNIITMTSSTYVYNAVGKFMVQIGHTGIRGFANAGGAVIHRNDPLADTGHIVPTFGIGLGYVFPARIMLELAFQYYAGYGKAVLKPALFYIPFLYTVHLKIGYRF